MKERWAPRLRSFGVWSSFIFTVTTDITQKRKSYVVFLSLVWVALKRTGLGVSEVAKSRCSFVFKVTFAFTHARTATQPCLPLVSDYTSMMPWGIRSQMSMSLCFSSSMPCFGFYRATRMHSADCAVARYLSVCLSVRPSHAGIESKRLHISSTFFSLWDSPTILVFPHQIGWQYSDGDPPNGGVECKGVWKITI